MTRLLPLAACLVLGLTTLAARADTIASAQYVISLGGNIVASAQFDFLEDAKAYSLALNAKVTGIAQLIASGTVKASSAGKVEPGGLQSEKFDMLTRSGGDDFNVKVTFDAGNVTSFVVNPPIVNNIDRVPVERKQLSDVNDMLASFILKGAKLDRAICDNRQKVFTGVERFDLAFRYARDDVATSPRTGYQGPVVLCAVKYTPVSGHYTTSELTKSLAEDDRILVWYAPLRDTGWFIPYRVLMTTSMGDLSMVLTKLD
ncbi:MAG TPA: DUF3108 domain-containing protein [Devosia sp.]|nr:DUF3108 domain-containing protein [Devosia sp.]